MAGTMRETPSRKVRYSISAALDIARHGDEGRRKAREIAGCTGIPGIYIRQILANLVKVGLLRAVAGPAGGYTLSRNASRITLLELIEAADGPLRVEGGSFADSSCEVTAVAALDAAWADAMRQMSDRLEAQTLASLLDRGRSKLAGASEVAAHNGELRFWRSL